MMAAVPSPWHDADIGAVGRAGSSADDSGTVAVSGGGADIWGVADAFHYVHAPLSGDGGITAQATAEQATNGWAKAGIMLRETTAADSRFVLLALTPSHGVALQVRSATHVTPVSAAYAGAAGIYLRLARAGGIITASDSADGQAWHALASVILPLPNTVQVGLAVTAHDNAQLNTSTFAHVALQTSMTPASPWSVGTSDYLDRWESDTAAVGGTVYVFGGFVNRALQATTETDGYTPATNTWAHLVPEPLPVTHAGTCAVGTTVYLAGGYLGQLTASATMTAAVQAYDTVHNTWSKLPSLPAPVAAGGLAHVGDELYFFGGINPGRQTDSARTWALSLDDPAAGWAPRANMPDARNHIGYATLKRPDLRHRRAAPDRRGPQPGRPIRRLQPRDQHLGPRQVAALCLVALQRCHCGGQWQNRDRRRSGQRWRRRHLLTER